MLMSLSDISAATPIQVNPHLFSTTTEIEAYCHNYRIWLPNFDEYHSMTAYMYPRASYERLITLSIVMDLLWFIDDYYTRSRTSALQEDDQALAKNLMTGMHILLHGEEGIAYETWHYACVDIRRQVIALNGQVWMARLIASLSEHLQASTYSINKIMVDGKVDVGRYLEVREYDSGMRVAIDCIEFAFGIELPEAVLAHPDLVEMRRDCANVGGLINDVVSFHKETQVNDSRFNLLSVLMESNGGTFDEAVHEAVIIINGFIEDFLMRERHLPEWGDATIDESVRLYVQGMKDQIGASLHWQLSTNRYRAEQSSFVELRETIAV